MAIVTAIAMALGATFIQAISAAIYVYSTAYQLRQAQKARRAARDAAEARKGFQLVSESRVETLPIVYGKALIGGTRVYHNTSSSFKYATPNADRIFSIGASGTAGGTLTYQTPEGGTASETYAGTAGTSLIQDINGSKNEFLFFQQALCQGPINAVYDVAINENTYIDDPALGDTYTNYVYRNGAFVEDKTPRASLRFDFHYNGTADSIMTANFNDRGTAAFTNIAYLSAVIRLDRDEPQFTQIPLVQTFLEGKKVRTIDASYALSTTRTYTNNPAYCLLDYLLDNTSGKGLSTDEIDLVSFRAAALVCDTIVQNNVYVGGKLYQPTDKSRNVTTRNLPLYECNIIIDVAKPVRENVESILSTMGDARLVWSQGKYKLLLQYPSNNNNIVLAATLTDDDLAHDSPVEISWPTGADRLNNCIIRFSNESENFKEDSVNWPPKTNRQEKRGIGGKRYIALSGWETTHEGGVFLNNYGVWDGKTENTTVSWKIIAPVSGTYTVKYTGDNSATLTIGAYSGTQSDWKVVKTGTVSLIANTEYTLTINASNTNLQRGLAAILNDPSGVTIWTTRNESYSSYINIAQTNTVYTEMLTEDSNLPLETDIFAEGVTDYYHALAKAEEIVRTSRTALAIKFEYIVKDKYLEPGDIIRLNSNALNLGNTTELYIKVDEIKLKDGALAEVKGTRFDYTQLAWSVKDDQYIKPANVYNFFLSAPGYLIYTPGNNALTGSPGTLTWGLSPEPSISGYILYFHEIGDLAANGQPNFVEIGRATAPPFYVPDLKSRTGIFGIRAFTNTITSDMTVTSTSQAYRVDLNLTPPTATSVAVSRYGSYNQSLIINWTIPANRAGGLNIPYDDHSFTRIYRGVVPTSGPVDYVEIGTSNAGFLIDYSPVFGTLRYKVKLVSSRGLEGDFSATADISYQYSDFMSLSQTLQVLSNSITSTQLNTTLNSRIDLIDTPTTGLVAKVSGLETTYGSTANAATSASNAANSAANAAASAANALSNASAAANSASNAVTAAFNASGFANSAANNAANALSYSNSASSYASNAAGSASNASNSAATATTASTNAQNNANSAANHAANSFTYSNNASNSATNAAGSASNASNSAATATTAASNAQNNANSAANSAANSLTYSNNAANSATTANTAASNASNSATTATSAATNAQNNANSAANSAANSLTYSNNAANSATTANTAASNASNSATTATTAATNAQNNANSAANSAANSLSYSNNAASSATTANTAASNASNSAATATSAATNAQNNANSAANSAANSLSYSNNAASSATTANTAASNASNSATTATNASTNAQNNANAAANHAANSLSYSNNSANSATSASGSASNASNSATTATNASTNAQNNANAAASHAANSLTYSNNASSSATTANNAASTATTQAGLATTAKNDAQGFSNAASASASSASSFANNASTSANSASTSSQSAATSAGSALTYSQNAANSATSASGFATAAANSYNQIQAVATGFDSAVAWNFEDNIESWSANNATASYNAGVIRVTSSGTDPQFVSPSNFSVNGQKNILVRARIKRIAGSGWDGKVFYATPGHAFNQSYFKSISDTTSTTDWRILEWDMTTLTAGGTDWITSTITQIRLDLGSTSSDIFDVDWVTVGKVAPQAYSAAIAQKMEVRAASNGVATAAYSVVVDANGRVSGFGLSSETNTQTGAQSSTFIVNADKFAITDPSNSNNAAKVAPFIVSNGTVYIDNARIKDLEASRIDSRGLSIKDANGNIILAAGSALNWGNISGQPSNIYNSNITLSESSGNINLNNAGGGSFVAVTPNNRISSNNISTYIADLAVNTLQIAGRAVTIPVGTQGYSDLYITVEDAVANQPIIITASFSSVASSSQTVTGYIFVGGTAVVGHNSTGFPYGNDGSGNPVGFYCNGISVSYLHTPSSSGSVQFSARHTAGAVPATIFAIQGKR